MVKKDFQLWQNKVLYEGLITFHDSIQDGPFKLLIEIINSKKYDFIQFIGNIAVFRKKYEKKGDKVNVYTILNSILLSFNRMFYLDFLKQDEKSIKNQVLKLTNTFI